MVTETSAYRFFCVAAFTILLSVVLVPRAEGQTPASAQQQIDAFKSLPASQQQALIQQLGQQLSPEQQQAVLQALQGNGQSTAQGASGTSSQQPPPEAGAANSKPLGLSKDLENLNPRFSGGDTLVIRFTPRGRSVDTTNTDSAIDETQKRLADANPYKLDRAGLLNLPGIPAIALGGLDVDQATVRLEAEPGLSSFDVKITRLPLDPVGTAALEPFGYELFDKTTSTTFAPATDIPVPTDYVVGPGDSVNVQLFGKQNAQYSLTINREGVINFPEIGPISVSGLDFNDLRTLIGQRVGEQMIGVRASTTLGELRSIRVFVVGDVKQPGSYTVSSLSTITNALFASGGVSHIGSLRRIALRRAGRTVSRLDLYDLLLKGDTSGDARLQPGDVIFVPPIGATVAVDGEVKRPAVYELNGEESVADLVELAGGLKANADRSDVTLERIVQGRGTAVQEIDVSKAHGRQIKVQDGDVLQVRTSLSQLDNAVRLSGNVYEPGLHEWTPGMTLADLLPNPKLVKPSSDLHYVLIKREVRPNVRINVLSADLASAWAHPASKENPVLKPRDTVYVFNLDVGRGQFVKPILKELQVQEAPNAPKRIVRVGGRVRAPGEYPLEDSMRVSDLLRAGGGMSDAAYAIKAELTRYAVVNGQYRETKLINVDLAAIRNGDDKADLKLAPYDYLNIKEVSRWRETETVTIRGEVKFPGVYPIRQGETLSSVLKRAGGVTSLAFPEGSVFTRVDLKQREREQIDMLARRIQTDLAAMSLSDPNYSSAVSTGQTLISQLRSAEPTGRMVIRLDKLIAGDTSADIQLRDGDQLMVPQYRQEVTVLGEVQYPTSHVYRADLERGDYIAMSGGLTSRADKKRIYVVRANGEVIVKSGGRWFHRSSSTQIRPGDTIVVPTEVDKVRPLAKWSSVTQVVYNLAIAAAAVHSF